MTFGTVGRRVAAPRGRAERPLPSCGQRVLEGRRDEIPEWARAVRREAADSW